MTTISVSGQLPYDVVVGTGVLTDGPLLRGWLPSDVRRVALVYTRSVAAAASAVARVLEALDLTVLLAEVPDGEAAKDVAVAAHLWSRLGSAGFTRTDAVVSVGGGATTDLAGFVAATWLRGVAVLHVPTTLLGMVDAAVGGKAAINTAEGKNLVGAFHPPVGVLCDLAALTTLPRRNLVSGMAEIVKAGFIADTTILDIVESAPEEVLSPNSEELREIIERAIRVKAEVVAGDLKERGGREFLNYGHTLAHAIEKVEDYTWRHGDAVSVGMVFAAELGRLAGHLDDAAVDRHRTILGSLGLPTAYRGDRWADLVATMRVDKKTRGARLRFVILEAIGRPVLLEDPAEQWLMTAYEKVSA